jgi:hypothetical protein
VRRLIAQEAAEQRQSERAGIGGRLSGAKRGGGYDASRIHSDWRFFVVSGYRTVLVEIVVVTERARSCARYLVVSGVFLFEELPIDTSRCWAVFLGPGFNLLPGPFSWLPSYGPISNG